MTAVEISNVGPIHHLSFELPAEGGVVVLEGPNGSGKSTTISTLAGEYDALTPRDGTLAGSARVGTLELTVGQRVTARGALEVRRLVPGADPSVLVDPGFKSAESNDLRRVLALCALAGITPDLGLFEKALGKPAGVELRAIAGADALAADTIPEQAKLVKAALEKASRSREDEAKSLRHRAGGLAASMEGVRDDEQSDGDALAAATEEAVRAKAALEGQDKAVRAQARERALAREQLAALSGSTVADREREFESLEAAFSERWKQLDGQAQALLAEEKAAAEAAHDVWKRVTELEFALAAAKKDLESKQAAQGEVGIRQRELNKQSLAYGGECDRQRELAKKLVEEARQNDAQVAKLRETLARDEQVGPTQDELASAELRLAQARRAQERGAVVREARKRQAEAVQLLKLADAEDEAAVKLREASQGVWQVVEDAVERVRPRGLRLSGGRVVFQHPARGEVYFEQLSQGERWRVALDAAVDAVGEGGLVGIRQEAWEGLDPENRAAIAAHARERRAVVVTAQASSGALRATVVG